MTATISQENRADRLPFFDTLRGMALVAMTIYHFSWDLEFFGWVTAGTISQPGWVLFARCIASSFLFLVGVSLVLAHERAIRWRMFWARFGQIAACAALITIATWFAIRDAFIFFGILHAIALFSLLGLALLRLHWFACVAIAIAVFVIGQNFASPFFAPPWLIWIGLSPVPPLSNDFVPLFPWFSATAAGIAAAKLAKGANALESIGTVRLPEALEAPLRFVGRNSLIYYMLHQPVLIGALWVFTAISGPPDQTASFIAQCETQCAATRDQTFCTAYCTCVTDGMKREGIFTAYLAGKTDAAQNETVQRLVQECTAKSEQ
ncbi:MAG: DUF1624 domain-containing protein [Ahrensia sp.]|nr:DUF1624 domain-containing protein [Ahrensia sp.]